LGVVEGFLGPKLKKVETEIFFALFDLDSHNWTGGFIGQNSLNKKRARSTTNPTALELQRRIYGTVEINMEAAIAHNNMGVSLLEQGLNDQALLRFKAAAHIMFMTSQQTKGRLRSGEFSGFTACVPILRTIPSCNAHFVQNTAIRMHCSNETVTTYTVESAMILTNMALCFHATGKESDFSVESMRNALILYEMAYNLGIQSSHDPRSHQIILTSLNNLGQIHNEIGNYETSELYLEDLSSYCSHLKGLTVKELHGYVLNSLVLRNPNKCAGAA
jgi:hypothetical protein